MNRIRSYYVTDRPHALKELIIFFTTVFIIMYGLGALGMVFREEIEKIFGPVSNRNLFVMILIYAPTLTGLILTVLYEGWSGLIALFKRGVFFTKPLWWLIAIFIIPVSLFAFGLFTYITGIESNSFKWNLFIGTFPLIIFSFNIFTDYGPIGEELGWRGYALPRLLQFHSPVMATAILSVFWTLFHLVAFFAPGTNQFGMSFIWFSLFCFSVCFIMSWLYMNTGGNWIASGLVVHYIINSFAINGAINVGPGLSISLSLVVIIIFLLKGFSKRPVEKDI